MAKKNFGDITFGRTLDINNTNANKKTKEVIKKAIKNPSKGNLIIATEEVNRDDSLTIKEKKTILSELNKKIVSIINFDNCPDDYESLKIEAKFLAGMTQYSFLLMAQRLLKIRDEKLYHNDGYSDFKSFIVTELSVAQRTAYDYINLIEVFGLRALAINKEIKYSKLIPAIPLLNKVGDEKEKEKLKIKFINDSEKKSYREIVKEINELKQQLGFFQDKEKEINLTSEIEKFKEIIIKAETSITYLDKENIRNLVDFLRKYL